MSPTGLASILAESIGLLWPDFRAGYLSSSSFPILTTKRSANHSRSCAVWFLDPFAPECRPGILGRLAGNSRHPRERPSNLDYG